MTVTARKYSDLAWAEIYGCHGIQTSSLKDCIRNLSLIINTVPAVILNEDILKEASAESLIIDLASKPGGVDFDTARRLGLKVVWALSLLTIQVFSCGLTPGDHLSGIRSLISFGRL